MNKAIEWIIFITENYAEMKSFYADILELAVLRDIPEEEFTQFQTGELFLAVYGKREVEKLMGSPVLGKPGSTIYSLGESSDVDSDYQQLAAKGVQFMTHPKTQPWGQRVAYFKDPDGNIWEIQQWIQKSS